MKRTTSEEVKHKRAVQGAMSIGTATIGLAALGTKGASVAMAKSPKMLRALPKSVTSQKLNNASLTLTTAGAGLGGASGYHFAALQRAENKAEHEREGKVNKMLEYSAFGVISKANWDDDSGARTAQYVGYGGAAAGVGTALAADEIHDAMVSRKLKPLKAQRRREGKKYVKAKNKGMQYDARLSYYRDAREGMLNGSGYDRAGVDHAKEEKFTYETAKPTKKRPEPPTAEGKYERTNPSRGRPAPIPKGKPVISSSPAYKGKESKGGTPKPKPGSPIYNDIRTGAHRTVAMNIDDAIAGAEKYTKKSRGAYQSAIKHKQNTLRLTRKMARVKTNTFGTPAIRTVALGAGGAALIGSEIARQNRVQKRDSGWWGA